MQFNEKLKQLRLEKGYSQAELDSRIFVSRSAVAKWENGLGLPSEQSLKLLAECLGVELSELMPEADPECEAVPGKRIAFGKKRMVIVCILCAFFLAAAVTAMVLTGRRSKAGIPADTIIPVGNGITRELIFETEKELDTGGWSSYSDSELHPDREFAPGRIFRTEGDSVQLPRLLVKQISNGMATYQTVDAERLSWFCSGGMQVSPCGTERLRIDLEQTGTPEYVGCANIRYGELCISVKIVREPIRVQRVEIGLSDGSTEIGLTRSKPLRIRAFPANAVCPEYHWKIDRIEKPDGTAYQGELSDYAYVVYGSGEAVLKTTAVVEIGSRIFVSAVTDAEHIRSNSLVIEVKRVAVEQIFFRPESFVSTHLTAGESQVNRLVIEPPDATVCVLREEVTVSLLTPELAVLAPEGDTWRLTASEVYSAVGQVIRVSVSTPDGYSRLFEWEIAPVAIDRIRVLNAETGLELESVFELSRGDSLYLAAEILPENASYDQVHYNLYSDTPGFGAYVSVSEDGVLTVSERAPDGLVIYLSVTVGHKSSQGYRLVILP